MSETVVRPERTVRFGPAAHEVYDVYAAGAPGPWVVLIHGGFWRAEYDRSHLRPLARALAGAGCPVALVEYRGIDTGTLRHPHAAPRGADTVDDAVRAVQQVLEREQPAAARVVGHSAGGHLALLAAHRLAPDPRLTAVVSLAGVLDLARAAALGLGDGVVHVFAGGTPQEVPETYAALDPAALGHAPVPVTAVHGALDEDVPAEVSRSWLRRAGLSGRDRLVEVAGSGHFELIDPDSAAWPVVLAETTARTVRG